MTGQRVRQASQGRHVRPGSLVLSDLRFVHNALWTGAGLVGLVVLAAKAGGVIGVSVVAVLVALVLLGHALPDDDATGLDESPANEPASVVVPLHRLESARESRVNRP